MKKLKAVLATVAIVLGTTQLAVSAAEARRLPWCGIYMNQYFGLAKRSLWVARNWAHEGVAAGGPSVGAVVVWPHHVGVIAGPPDAAGRWLVHSGNDGNAVRTRYRSLAGAIAFRQVSGGSQNFHVEVQQQAAAGGNQNLMSLRDRGRASKRLRQPRAFAVAAAEPFSANRAAFAHFADTADVMRPEQIETVRKRSRMLRRSAISLSAQPVYAAATVGELELTRHRAPRTAHVRAERHPSSQASLQLAYGSPLDMQSDRTTGRALFAGAGGDWHGYPPRVERRGYRRR